MLSIDEASLILLKVLSLPSVEIAENILRDAVFRGEIGYDQTRATVAGSNALIVTTGITPSGAQAVDEEGFSEFLNRRKQLLGLMPTDSRESSQDAIDTPQPPKDKSLPTKERETMLKLIIGMAIDGYGYDLLAAKSPLTGEGEDSLHAHLQLHGISVDPDTIRKYLKEAKALLSLQNS